MPVQAAVSHDTLWSLHQGLSRDTAWPLSIPVLVTGSPLETQRCDATQFRKHVNEKGGGEERKRLEMLLQYRSAEFTYHNSGAEDVSRHFKARFTLEEIIDLITPFGGVKKSVCSNSPPMQSPAHVLLRTA